MTTSGVDFVSFSNFCLAANRIKPVKAGQGKPSNKILNHFSSLALFFQTQGQQEDGMRLFRLLFPDLDTRRRYGLFPF